MSLGAKLMRAVTRSLDKAIAKLPAQDDEAEHLRTGARGEDEAYFYLREQGYTIVARNFRSPRRKGEIDLIGWHEGTLCFVEVKTRSKRDFAPAESAVDDDKRHDLSEVARQFLLRMEEKPALRFDIVSVYFDKQRPELTLFKDCFQLQ
jgi:putative endonuclease